MMQTIAVTPKWQIHIPVKFRKKLKLVRPGFVEVKLVRDTIVIKPKSSLVLKLAGKYQKRKPVKKIDIEKIREKIDYSQL